jgi:hypothetical protein
VALPEAVIVADAVSLATDSAVVDVAEVEVPTLSSWDCVELMGMLVAADDPVDTVVAEAVSESVGATNDAVLVAVTSWVAQTVRISVAMPLPSSDALAVAVTLSLVVSMTVVASARELLGELEEASLVAVAWGSDVVTGMITIEEREDVSAEVLTVSVFEGSDDWTSLVAVACESELTAVAVTAGVVIDPVEEMLASVQVCVTDG